MNLILSGPIDRPLLDAVTALASPRQLVVLHSRASRLVDVDDSASVRAIVLALCDAARVDHAYIEEGRCFADFKLLAMDMDSTLITIECIDEIADFAGKKAEVAAITEAAMRGDIADFAESLRRRVSLLAGTPVTVLDRVFNERLSLSPGASELIQAARDSRMFTLLASGGFTYFTKRLKDELQLSDECANILEISDNRLTGRVAEPIIDANGKLNRVRKAIRTLDCTDEQVLVIGDGANDIPMMGAAKYSIAYRAKPATNAVAHSTIKYGSLLAVLDYFSQQAG